MSNLNRQRPSLIERVTGAYLGLAVGDALGATTEFLTPNEIRHKYGVHQNITGGGWLHLKPGQVTDDTEMSLALGQSIIINQGMVVEAVAQAYSDWMRTKPVDIGNTVRRGIVHFRRTGEVCVEENEYDAGNGACMRSLPIAILHCHSISQVMNRDSRLQSHITHNNPIADAGTETLLKMLAASFQGETKNDLLQYANHLVEQYPTYRYDKRLVENPSGWIIETLQVVFQAFFKHNNVEDILIDVVNRGGDADTTGAIAGMLAGALYGKKSFPERWLNALDKKVKTACEQQAIELLNLADHKN